MNQKKMRRTIITMLIALLFQGVAFAYDFVNNGIAYEKLKDGTLSVVPSGIKQNGKYILYTGDLVIPSTVTYAGKKYKVTEIGEMAFRGCTGLTSVKLPESIRKIGGKAFCEMEKLKTLHIPASVSDLVPGFIYNTCGHHIDVSVSPQNKYYVSKNNCVYNKKMTHIVYVPGTVKKYIIPSSVRTIGDYAFSESTLKRVVIPKTVTHIGGRSFTTSRVSVIDNKTSLKRLKGSEWYNSTAELPLWASTPQIYRN